MLRKHQSLVLMLRDNFHLRRCIFFHARQIPSQRLFRKSIKRFVSDAIDQAVHDEYQSIAFPAIGCGQLGYSITLVAQAMVGEAYRKLSKHRLSVLFVIQPTKNDIYDEFRNQINRMQPKPSSNTSGAISERVGKGRMEVEEGDLTSQNVMNMHNSSERYIFLNLYFL